MNLYQLCFVLILFLVFPECKGSFFKKNEKIGSTIGYLRSCGREEDNRLKLYILTRKYNRTHTATSMNITVYEDFGEEYRMDMELMIWGDGGWKRNFFRYKRSNACEALNRILGAVWLDIISTAGVNVQQGCPIKAGYYYFDDYYIDFSKLPIVSMPGRFMMIVIVTKNNLKQLCIEIQLELKVTI